MSPMNSNETTADVLDHDFNSSSARSYRKWRHIKDVATRYLMAFGGVSVIASYRAYRILFALCRCSHVQVRRD